jgi:hypothetical protein
MSKKYKIYEIKISEEALDMYKVDDSSASDMAETLGLDSVMTDFQWDEDILTARIIDEISVEDALSELKNVEFIESVDES